MDDGAENGRTVHAMGERVAVVETKIVGIEKDTAVIRSTLHGINGEMQKFVVLESQCVAALAQIVDQTKHLPDLAARMLMFDELRPRLVGLIDKEHGRDGAWKAYAMIGSAAVGAVAVLGTIGTGLIWLIGKFTGHA